MATIAEILSRTRAKKRLSRAGAARELGITPMTYRAWETGFQMPDADKVDAIALFTDEDRIEILGAMRILRQGEVKWLRKRGGAGGSAGMG